MPYPRIHITNVRGHGIPPCPLCFFSPPPQGVRVLPRNAHLGGYGIPAIPTPPSANPPTEFTEFTEISGVEESPTDFTDAHRWLGCLDFCVEIVWWLRGYGRDAIPSYNCTDWGLKFCVFCAIRGKISQQEVSVGSANSVGGYVRFAWLVQWRPLHPLVGCKKCIDFFVVTKFRCIFAM